MSYYDNPFSVFDPDLKRNDIESEALLKQRVPTFYVKLQKELSKLNFGTKGSDTRSILKEEEFIKKYAMDIDQDERENAVYFLTLQGKLVIDGCVSVLNKTAATL